MKLYWVSGHVAFLLTFVFEGWARSDSSPSASAQYISASFRYWRLCRSDFATIMRRGTLSPWLDKSRHRHRVELRNWRAYRPRQEPVEHPPRNREPFE